MEWRDIIINNYNQACNQRPGFDKKYSLDILIKWWIDKEPSCPRIYNWIKNSNIILGYPKVAEEII
jgi:hypothetical protein